MQLLSNFKKTWNILFRSNHPDYEWLQRLFFISLILVLIVFVKYYLPTSIKQYLFPFESSEQKEGFEQHDPYVLQIQNNAYDSFYADVYEVLHPNDQTFMENFVKYIENETQPSKEISTLSTSTNGSKQKCKCTNKCRSKRGRRRKQ